jgi:hypothetical protein
MLDGVWEMPCLTAVPAQNFRPSFYRFVIPGRESHVKQLVDDVVLQKCSRVQDGEAPGLDHHTHQFSTRQAVLTGYLQPTDRLKPARKVRDPECPLPRGQPGPHFVARILHGRISQVSGSQTVPPALY